MTDYVAAVPWETGRTDQIMSARWLNRISHNNHALYDAAFAGGATFRQVTFRSPFLRSQSWSETHTIWTGYYRHVNKYISGVYTLHRHTDPVAVDNAEAPFEPGHLARPYWNNDNNGLWYLADDSQPTTITVQIDTTGAGSWTTLHTHSYSDNNADYDGSFQAQVDSLGLTAWAIYKVRVLLTNGCATLRRLYGEGNGTAWPTLPDASSVTPWSVADWNTFVTAQRYLAERIGCPVPGLMGVRDRRGSNQDTTITTTPYRVWIRHLSNQLQYRIWIRGVASGDDDQLSTTDWPSDWTGDSVIRLMIAYGGNTHFVDGQNDIYPAPGFVGPYPPGLTADDADQEFHQGARIRYLKYSSADGYDQRRWVQGVFDLSSIGITPGDWYEVYLEAHSNTAGDNTNFYCGVSFVGEIPSIPTTVLRTTEWTPHAIVHGTGGGPGYTGGQTDDWVFDLTNTIKPAADLLVQPLVASSVADWPERDLADVYYFARRRPYLHWAGGTTDEPVTLNWGSPLEPQSQELGFSDRGVLDLRSVRGLDVGTPFWLSPRHQVRYAMEAYQP